MPSWLHAGGCQQRPRADRTACSGEMSRASSSWTVGPATRSRSARLPPHTSQLATKLSADGCGRLPRVRAPSRWSTAPASGRRPAHPRATSPRARRSCGRPSACARSSSDPATAAREQQARSAAAPRRPAGWSALAVARVPDAPHRRHRLQDARRAAAGPARRGPRRQPRPHRGSPQPLKRVGDVGHAVALLRARATHGRARDASSTIPYRPGGTQLRGEWDPAKQVRQFAFRGLGQQADRGVGRALRGLDGGEPRPRPAQQAHRPSSRRRPPTAAKQAARTEQRLRARIAQLEASGPLDCTPAVTETLDAERVAIRDLVEARRAAA